MYYYVGIAFVAGVSVIFLIGIANYCIGIIYNKYQEQLMKIKDERIKKTNELLNGK